MSLLRRRMMIVEKKLNRLIDGTYSFAIVSDDNHIKAVNAGAWVVANILFETLFDIKQGDSIRIILSNMEYTSVYFHDISLSNGAEKLYLLPNKNMITQNTNTVIADKDYLGINTFAWMLRGGNITYECDVLITINDKRIL